MVVNKDKILNKGVIKVLNFAPPYSFGIYLTHVLFLNLLTENFNILK